jgi:hypothetical protein
MRENIAPPDSEHRKFGVLELKNEVIRNLGEDFK